MPGRRRGRSPDRAGAGTGPIAGTVRLRLLILMLALLAAAHLFAFWPGIMTWDAIRQYGQALTGRYDDWHPPAMNWLWRRLGTFGPGPAPMMVLQALLYWSGFAAILLKLADERRWLRVIAIAAVALLPVSLVLVGTVLKDSLMAGALLAATGLILWRRSPAGSRDRLLGLLAATLLLAAATLRFNAVPACLPLLLLLVPQRWIAGPRRLIVAGAIAAIPLAVALPLANRLLAAERSHVELSLILYDLGGITRFSGRNVFPPLAVADPVAVNRGCYSPVSWDRYSWWVDRPCPIGFTALAPILERPGAAPTAIWLGAIVRHPLAYSRHRLAHFNQDIRFMPDTAALPPLSLASDPNRWNFQETPGRLRAAIASAAVASLASPLGWPACWLALAAGVLLAAAGQDRVATALAASSLLYGLSYLPLGVAAEVRYHLWTVIAAGVAAALGLGRGIAVPRWRLLLAAAVPALTVLLAVAGRA